MQKLTMAEQSNDGMADRRCARHVEPGGRCGGAAASSVEEHGGMLRDAVPEDHPALRSIFRRSSLSNAGDRALLLANPEHLVWREPTSSQAFRVRVAVTADAVI